MNAINFIQHYGLNTAIRITEDSKNDDFWDTETGFYTDQKSESCVCLSDLKRLVKSVDIIKEFGGCEEAINRAYELTMQVLGFDPSRIEQAIEDYESLFSNDMGDDSHIENHISPLCKMGVK